MAGLQQQPRSAAVELHDDAWNVPACQNHQRDVTSERVRVVRGLYHEYIELLLRDEPADPQYVPAPFKELLEE
jgi:hypothetical protein